MPIRKADDRVALNTPWGVISLLNMYGNACYQQLHTHPNSHSPPQAVLSLLFAVVDGIDANSLGFQEHPDGINLLVCNTTQSGAEVAVESDRIGSNTRPALWLVIGQEEELKEEVEVEDKRHICPLGLNGNTG